ncbi:MAG TPA: 30S ribosomal protein S3, partial [Desulfocapsa sulfexigens]|nr:30S ribosomal protein S3 [Desulfocapsa sulfexigens]
MGQKVNPLGFRLGITRTWDSIWYANKDYSKNLIEDQKIRKFLKKRLQHAALSKIILERTGEKVRVKLFTARPGIIIGKKGSEIELLKKDLEKLIYRKVVVDIQEVRRPEADAQLVAENIAQQLIRRIAFRRAMKKSVNSALRFGVKGIKISCSGRLGGAEMSRCEWVREGRVPLHTLRADVDYALA